MSTHTTATVAVPNGTTVQLDPGSGATLLVQNTGTVVVGCAVSDHERAQFAQLVAQAGASNVHGGSPWCLLPGSSRSTNAVRSDNADTPSGWVPITAAAPAGGADGSLTVTTYAL